VLQEPAGLDGRVDLGRVAPKAIPLDIQLNGSAGWPTKGFGVLLLESFSSRLWPLPVKRNNSANEASFRFAFGGTATPKLRLKSYSARTIVWPKRNAATEYSSGANSSPPLSGL
jgi:hypothetical protein